MSTYVMSDIHGAYERFMDLLQKIHFSDEDTLYILGDVVDRGPHPMKVLFYMMEHPNIIPIIGNHEVMALRCLKMLLRTVDEIQENLTVEELGMLSDWMLNGAEPTINAFHKLDEYEREDVLDYLGEFSAYEWVQADGEKYFLVHAGLGNFAPGRSLDDYTLDELVWQRADYDVTYFKDVYVLTGHTPTQKIADNPRPGYIYRKNRHIAIDCAAFAEGGRLAAVCLESGEEFYSEV